MKVSEAQKKTDQRSFCLNSCVWSSTTTTTRAPPLSPLRVTGKKARDTGLEGITDESIPMRIHHKERFDAHFGAQRPTDLPTALCSTTATQGTTRQENGRRGGQPPPLCFRDMEGTTNSTQTSIPHYLFRRGLPPPPFSFPLANVLSRTTRANPTSQQEWHLLACPDTRGASFPSRR